jgi:hypothetical protein
MKTKTYEDFDLSIEKAGDRYRARVLSSPDGTAPATEFEMPFSDLELENFILRFGQTRRIMRNTGVAGETANRSLREFGTRLYSAIFSRPISDRLHGSLGVVGQKEDTGLRIRLRLSDAPDLIDIPWEYLFDASSGRFLTLSVDTPLVRYLDLPGQVKPLAVQPPLRILVMLSSPAGYAGLNVEQEWQKLKDAVADLERRGVVVLERMEKPTLSELQRRLRKEDVHIFHFIGHGGFDEAAQDGMLILETEDSKAKPTSGKYLGTLLHDEKTIRLAVLNACEGGRTSSHDPFAGVGQSLVQQGIPAVVAMQFEISDQAAITLAHEFYAALADSYPVDAALAEARKAIFAQDNAVEWGTPVLYMRAQDGRIFDVATIEALSLQTEQADRAVDTASTPSHPSKPITGAQASRTASPGENLTHLAWHWLSGEWRRVRNTPVSLGVRIASWSALVALLGFFLPWFGFRWGDITGAGTAVRGDFVPEILFILLSPLLLLGLRLVSPGRGETRLGFPLLVLGIVPLIVLYDIRTPGAINLYGIVISAAAFLGILAGGIAELALPSGEASSTTLRFSLGHLVATIGAGLALLFPVLAIADTSSEDAVIGSVLLITSSALAWLWALMAQRRGQLTWIDSAGDVLAAATGLFGAVMISPFYIPFYGGSTPAVIIALVGGASMLIGGGINFILAGRQNATRAGKRGVPLGYRIAIIGQIITALLWVLATIVVMEGLFSAYKDALGFLPLIALAIPVFAVLTLALRSRRRENVTSTDSKGLLALGGLTAALSIAGGMAADITNGSYGAYALFFGVLGTVAGALTMWGGLLNRRAANPR